MFRPLYGMSNRAPIKAFERVDAKGYLPRGDIDGLTLSNDAGDLTNDIGLAPGVGRSTVNAAYVYNNAYSTLTKHQRDIEITDALIKQIDVAWAPGNGGGRSAAALADGTWHAYGIGGKGLKDGVIFHNSATQSSVLAALPGGYTAYRRIGSLLRESSALVGFTQAGDRFQRKTMIRDVNAVASAATTAVTKTVSVPVGVVVIARLIVITVNGSTNHYFKVSALDETDNAASITNFTFRNETAGLRVGGPVEVKTDTAASFRVRQDAAGAADTHTILTDGWIDFRDKNS